MSDTKQTFEDYFDAALARRVAEREAREGAR